MFITSGQSGADFCGGEFGKWCGYGTESGEQVAIVGGDWIGLVEIFKGRGTKEVMLDMSNWIKPSLEKIVPSVALQLDL